MKLLTTILILSLLAPRTQLQGVKLVLARMYERILAYHEQVQREIGGAV